MQINRSDLSVYWNGPCPDTGDSGHWPDRIRHGVIVSGCQPLMLTGVCAVWNQFCKCDDVDVRSIRLLPTTSSITRCQSMLSRVITRTKRSSSVIVCTSEMIDTPPQL